MNSPMDPPLADARGLSRRQVLRRVAGSLAGGLPAGLGLLGGRSEATVQSVVSLRAVMQQISPNCNPAHGIRLMLPDTPVVSLRDIIRRYYRR